MKGTMLECVAGHARSRPHHPAYRVKRQGIWAKRTWAELWADVQALAAWLISREIQPGCRVAILGDNSPEWLTAELAVQAAGAIPVGIYQDCMAPEVAYVVRKARAEAIFVRDEEQLDKVAAIRAELGAPRFAVLWELEGMLRYLGQPWLVSYEQALESGRQEHARCPQTLEERLSALTGDSPAFILPTSGTTAHPKLAVLTHRNVLAAAASIARALGLRGDEHLFSALPMAWIGEQMLTVLMSTYLGVPVHFPETPDSSRTDIVAVQPDLFLAPPRVWEDIASTVRARADEADPLKRAVLRWGLAVAVAHAERELAGRRPTPWQRLLYGLAYWLVARPIRGRFGLANARIALTGGAALGPDVFKFFKGLGLDIRQIYGQTENAACVSVHRRGRVRPTTVGEINEGVEVQVSEQGEILVRGPVVFAGYFEDEASTRRALDGGWLRTGDAGFFDDAGHLVVLDRIQHVSRLKDGTRFAPQYLENQLKYSPFIKEAVVFGESRDWIAAILCIDFETVGNWARRRRIAYTTYQSLAAHPEVRQLIREEVRRVNTGLPEPLRVRSFVLLNKELHPDDEEMTRTRKLRRGIIEARYGDVIDALYSDAPSVAYESVIRYMDGREGVVRAELAIERLEGKACAVGHVDDRVGQRV